MILSDFGTIITGKTPSTKNADYWDGSIPFVTPGDIQGSKHIFSTARYVTKSGMTAVKGAILPKNAVCVSCIGNIGYVGKTTEQSITNQQINSIVVNDNHNSDYVYYLIKSLWKYFKNYEGQSTTLSILNKSQFSKIEVIDRCRDDEERIAEILNSLDDKIEKNQQINDNLEQQAASLYYSMFVSYDYYPSIEFEESELGRIPKGWKVLTLSDVTTNIRDRVHNNSYRVLSALNSGILQPSDEYFTKQVFSKDIGNYIVVAENDFAYNPARVNIGSLGINDLGYIGCVSPVYVVFRTEDEYQNFMRFFVKSKRFQEEVKTRASGSVRQAMNYTDFSLIRLAYPPQNAVREFNAAVDPIWETIKHLQQENDKLSELRDYLLPRLMSGDLDVSGIEL